MEWTSSSAASSATGDCNGTYILSTIINNVDVFPHIHLPPESILFCAI